MSNVNQSNAGYIVAIVTVIVTAIGNGYSSWSNNSSLLALEKLKGEAIKERDYAKSQLQNYTKQCDTYAKVAGELANNYGAVIKEHDLDKDSDVEGALWRGILLLSKEPQEMIIKEYFNEPGSEDKYGIRQTHKMVKLTLSHLALEARKCQLEINTKT